MRRRRIRLTLPAFVWLYGILSLYPLFWILTQSTRPDVSFLTSPWSLPSPDELELTPYSDAWTVGNIGNNFTNSVVVSSLTVGLVLLLSIGSGYALSRLQFRGKLLLYGTTMIMMVIPSVVLFLPLFMVSDDLNLLDTHGGLILPYTVFTLPLGVYLMKANFDSLPTDLFEAARLDGCSEWRVFWRVMLPLVPGGIATVGMLTFMGVWDEYMWALTSVQTESLFTLPLGLVTLDQNKFMFGYNVSFAAMVIVALPVVLVLLISQRGFLRAVTTGAMK